VIAVDPRQRIGDAERERATSLLAQHYADGRLDHEEYDERLDAIWTARTQQDLAVLFADLPRPVAPPRPAPPAVRRRRPLPWLPVLAILLALSFILDAPLFLAILLLPWLNRRLTGRPGWSGRGCGAHGPRGPYGPHGTSYRRR
jgi:hypothetical protein